jgi:NAD(P)-dependent dehydrogenase (short-subunit alcohol dehydrogenase family)
MTTGTLDGHTALVTGGSRGIGAAIVRSLAQAGAAVAVNYRERAGEANASSMPSAGPADVRLRLPPTSRNPMRSPRWFNV